MSNPYQDIPAYEDVYGGQYFSPADLHTGPVTAKIIDLTYDEIFCKGVGKNSKIILTLAGQKKKIVVNKTSAKALAYAFSKDFAQWKGKTVHADAGNVNGKAAVLLTPIKERVPSKPNVVAEVAKAVQGVVEEPGATDGMLEECDVMFVKIGRMKADQYSLLDANGCNLWRCSEDVYGTLVAIKASNRIIHVCHIMHHIETVAEIKG